MKIKTEWITLTDEALIKSNDEFIAFEETQKLPGRPVKRVLVVLPRTLFQKLVAEEL